jgi:hypothetical protein
VGEKDIRSWGDREKYSTNKHTNEESEGKSFN